MIHQVFREVFQGRLMTEHKESTTGVAVIQISWAKPGGQQERRREWASLWSIAFSSFWLRYPEPARVIDVNPPYIHFTLQKTNRETQEALSILANILHCHVSRDLGISGTKDKRSVSCQRVSYKRGRRTIQQVWATVNRVNSRGKGGKLVSSCERGDKGIRLGDFSYAAEPLKLGQSRGNRFVIVLRSVLASFSHPLPQVFREYWGYFMKRCDAFGSRCFKGCGASTVQEWISQLFWNATVWNHIRWNAPDWTQSASWWLGHGTRLDYAQEGWRNSRRGACALSLAADKGC